MSDAVYNYVGNVTEQKSIINFSWDFICSFWVCCFFPCCNWFKYCTSSFARWSEMSSCLWICPADLWICDQMVFSCKHFHSAGIRCLCEYPWLFLNLLLLMAPHSSIGGEVRSTHFSAVSINYACIALIFWQGFLSPMKLSKTVRSLHAGHCTPLNISGVTFSQVQRSPPHLSIA